jgi:biopolymer transport protein ExbD
VFFIYAMLSMVVQRGLKVELPAASTAQVDRREHVTITLTKDNAVYVDDEQVPLNRLVVRVVARLAASGKDLPVFINGDRKAALGVAVQVLDDLRAAGINEVFITSREEEE